MNVTEDLLVEMDKQEVSKAELGRKLSKSKAYIGQTLNGERNITLATLSDICFELELKPKIVFEHTNEVEAEEPEWTDYSPTFKPGLTHKSRIAVNDGCGSYRKLVAY